MTKLYTFKRYLMEAENLNEADYPVIRSAQDAREKLRELWEEYGEAYITEASQEEREYEDYSHLWMKAE
jgi:hypothetical protein